MRHRRTSTSHLTRYKLDGASAIVNVQRVPEDGNDTLDDMTKSLCGHDITESGKAASDGIADDRVLAPRREDQCGEESGETVVQRRSELLCSSRQHSEAVEEVLPASIVTGEECVGLLNVV